MKTGGIEDTYAKIAALYAGEVKGEKPRFTKQLLMDGLKFGLFKKIVILTGAGISAAEPTPTHHFCKML